MNIKNRCIICSFILAFSAFGEEVPKSLLEGLSSEQFKEREASQIELGKWADEKGPSAISAIYKVYAESDDPELRNRCYQALRKQSDKDYLKDGKGYLGVQMREELHDLPGDDKPRICVRITFVVVGSQADLAGIQAGDLIASMDGKKWYEQGSIDEFSETIASYKPQRRIVFEVMRAGKDELIQVPVILGRRPVEDLRSMYYQDLEKLDSEARDRHFKEWLEKQKATE
jgi:predicted metalloprotease with PDZ domain